MNTRSDASILVFAKAPEPGLAKTRLIPALGAAGAARLAAHMLEHACAAAAAARCGPVTLCVSPDATHAALQRVATTHGLALQPQGEGDLGQRMQRAFQQAFATADRALLMGTDIPAWSPADLQAAAQALDTHDAVLVPALDGGYALVGLRASAAGALPTLFEGMTWSTPLVLVHTRQRLRQAGLRWIELPAVADVDTPEDLDHVPPAWLASPGEPTAPGRSCPLHYRYSPAVFATPAPAALQGLDVLYVVGGLYGNHHALARVLALFEQEAGRKRLVFNGDFHWFDADPQRFAQVQQAVLAHTALRGNVETELAADPTSVQDDAGCGCAYPDWVGDDVVQRSNRILARLRPAVTAKQREQLAALPMWLRADVGPLRLGLVHGDAQSLAGWGFAQEHLKQAGHRERVRRWFAQAGVDAFASTHTCLPVFQPVMRAEGRAEGDGLAWVFNNGAAGMPNFAGDGAGLLTRVALSPPAPGLSRAGVQLRGVHVDALAVDIDAQAWQADFLAQWPEGTDAHASYFGRMARGPAYRPGEVVREAG